MPPKFLFRSVLAIGFCALGFSIPYLVQHPAMSLASSSPISLNQEKPASPLGNLNEEEKAALTQLTVSGSALNLWAIKKVLPEYPVGAKLTETRNRVQVRIEIHVFGEVTLAEAINGHPSLRQAAVEAAKQWKFKPVDDAGTLQIIHGVLTFNFQRDNNLLNVIFEPRPYSPKLRNTGKLHPSAIALLERMAAKSSETIATEAAFVQNNRANLYVRLSDKTNKTNAQLKKLGFKVVQNSQTPNLITGLLPIEKLQALADLEVTSFVSPKLQSQTATVKPDKPEDSLLAIRHLTVYNAPLLAGAIKKVMPVPPPMARASGLVKVRIALNTDGEVEEAEVFSGHPLLRNPVIEAVRQWQFKPSVYDGGTMKIHGVLAFRFSVDKNGETTVVAEAQPIPANLQKVWTKLHPSISAVIERLNAKGDTTASEPSFVRNGKANLQVQLTEKTDAAIAQLKKIGLEITKNAPNSELINGRLPTEKLEALADLKTVRYLSPLNHK
ncbi:MAG: energy transducer TonB [Acidobacteriota bacterium]|nr:energy transducer TonB [Acidobacteriota bacterium]